MKTLKKVTILLSFALGFTIALMMETATDIVGRLCRVSIFGLFASGFLIVAFGLSLGFLKEVKEVKK